MENNACVQEASEYAGVSGSGIVGSEDCLYLDITAPIDFREVFLPRYVLDTRRWEYLGVKRLLRL